MGVSGTGKSTVGRLLAARLGRTFVEGDDLHPPENIAKMSAGHALDDDDRRPWLLTLAGVLAEHHAAGRAPVLTCSSLRRSYRDLLRSGLPPEAGPYFVHLHAPADVLQQRVESREHFMPPSLLRSQLDTLELLGADEAGTTYDVRQPAEAVVERVLADLE